MSYTVQNEAASVFFVSHNITISGQVGKVQKWLTQHGQNQSFTIGYEVQHQGYHNAFTNAALKTHKLLS